MDVYIINGGCLNIRGVEIPDLGYMGEYVETYVRCRNGTVRYIWKYVIMILKYFGTYDVHRALFYSEYQIYDIIDYVISMENDGEIEHDVIEEFAEILLDRNLMSISVSHSSKVIDMIMTCPNSTIVKYMEKFGWQKIAEISGTAEEYYANFDLIVSHMKIHSAKILAVVENVNVSEFGKYVTHSIREISDILSEIEAYLSGLAPPK